MLPLSSSKYATLSKEIDKNPKNQDGSCPHRMQEDPNPSQGPRAKKERGVRKSKLLSTLLKHSTSISTSFLSLFLLFLHLVSVVRLAIFEVVSHFSVTHSTLLPNIDLSERESALKTSKTNILNSLWAFETYFSSSPFLALSLISPLIS